VLRLLIQGLCPNNQRAAAAHQTAA